MPTISPVNFPINSPTKPSDPNSSISWRIWSHPNDLVVNGGWAWDVAEIEFYSDVDCSAGNMVPNNLANPIESGNAGFGWEASNAFGGAWSWGGRPDDDGMFWIGMMYDEPVTVKCIRVMNDVDKPTKEFQIQALNQSDELWDIVSRATDLDTSSNAWNKISIKFDDVSPTTMPTRLPTSSPTTSPVNLPTNSPTESCKDKEGAFVMIIKKKKKKIRMKINCKKVGKKKYCKKKTTDGKRGFEVCPITCGKC